MGTLDDVSLLQSAAAAAAADGHAQRLFSRPRSGSLIARHFSLWLEGSHLRAHVSPAPISPAQPVGRPAGRPCRPRQPALARARRRPPAFAQPACRACPCCCAPPLPAAHKPAGQARAHLRRRSAPLVTRQRSAGARRRARGASGAFGFAPETAPWRQRPPGARTRPARGRLRTARLARLAHRARCPSVASEASPERVAAGRHTRQ